MKQSLARRFASSLLAVTFVLALAGCAKAPPEALPWATTAEQQVEILSSNYSTSRFWGCGWRGTCPEKRWSHCLRVTPRTRDAAVTWYRHFHAREFAEVTQDANGQQVQAYATIIADYEARLEANEFDEAERAEKIATIGRLRQAVAQRSRFAAELAALESRDAVMLEAVYQKAKAGFHLTAEYSISRAGTPEQTRSGYLLKGGCQESA